MSSKRGRSVEPPKDKMDKKAKIKTTETNPLKLEPNLTNLDQPTQNLYKRLRAGIEKRLIKKNKNKFLEEFRATMELLENFKIKDQHPNSINLLACGPGGKEMFSRSEQTGTITTIEQRNLGLMHITSDSRSGWSPFEVFTEPPFLEIYILICHWSWNYQFRSMKIDTPHLRDWVDQSLILITPE